MPVPLLVAGVVLAVAATAVSISSAQQQAKAGAAAAKANAQQAANEQETQAQMALRESQVAQNQAQQEQQLSAVEQDSQRRQAERLFAEQRAIIGASGMEFSGSPLLIAIESAQEAELSIAQGQWQSEQRQLALRDTASVRTFEAGEFRRGARNSLALGSFQAAQYRTAGRYATIQAGLQGASQIAGLGTNYLLTQRSYGSGAAAAAPPVALPKGS
jgi:hypothetical protein